MPSALAEDFSGYLLWITIIFVPVEIKYLKLIKTIAEEGNISNSSDKLFLTQSALSHQLKDIENQLGLKIFFRSRNKWKLTDEGEELYKLAKKVLSEIDKSIENIKSINEGSKGNLRLKTECYSFYSGMPAFIQKMGFLYPEISIELKVEALGDPFSKILENELDVAIVTCQSQNDDLISLELFEDEIFAIMHEEHRFGSNEFLSADDFQDIHLIINSFPIDTVTIYMHFLKAHNVMPKKITPIPLTEVAIELVSANMGVMCVPRWSSKAFELPSSLIFKRIGKNGLKRKHYLVFRKEDQNKCYMKDFVQNLREEFVAFRT